MGNDAHHIKEASCVSMACLSQGDHLPFKLKRDLVNGEKG
jgi:hypothetical protein